MTPRWFNNLRVQIVLLLSLALFPLAAVAIYQTGRVEDESTRNAELALLALTRSAAKEEELFIQRALGVARFFGTVAGDLMDDPEACVEKLQSFVSGNSNYSFLGVVPPSGIMTCTSAGGEFDASTGPYFAQLMETKTRTIVANPRGPLSQESIFNISEPFEIDGEFSGFVSISIPHRGMPKASLDLEKLGLVDLLTFNASDEILTARNSMENAHLELPVDWTFGSLRSLRGHAFKSVNQLGETRTYTVVPIQGSSATVLAVWRTDKGPAGQISDIVGPAVFPILMWIASMAVAMISIHTLVLRHIHRLRHNMDEFAETRSVETLTDYAAMPNELQSLVGNFERMTDDIMREEAELEDMVREKNVLIKEVHHRVKNNLQLISSIMNMKIRAAQHDETKSVLMRLQDRVLSLASIHRDLYQSKHGGMANVGALVSDIIENSVEIAAVSDDSIRVETDVDPVLLYPDQAVPLALLVAEGMTNAMKYIGDTGTSKPFIRASLKKEGDECSLRLENSVGLRPDAESTGLGKKLINAFAVQLGGEIHLEDDGTIFTLRLRFKIEEFVPDARDF
ncbi:sensor histidine kinase [Alphaproteobacteria bacterium KMM 3653]|uniref:histidine kinase n=1 Tax=Harenicola maris TaxID=2841044 RepID=A0AAP2CX45_9RHOB|nr:sensor histidine kinase [Harenicola maris]